MILIQKVVKTNTTNISQKEYDDVRIEYVKIVHESVIQNENDVTINEVWNVYTIQKIPDPKSNTKAETKKRGEFRMMRKKVISSNVLESYGKKL